MIKNKQQGYYTALQQSGSSGNSTLFIHYMCSTILEAINTLQTTRNDQDSDQDSDQVKALLNVLPKGWLSAAEIMQLLGLSHKANFRKNYLDPALRQHLIEMQYPDSPRSPKQKYRKCRI